MNCARDVTQILTLINLNLMDMGSRLSSAAELNGCPPIPQDPELIAGTSKIALADAPFVFRNDRASTAHSLLDQLPCLKVAHRLQILKIFDKCGVYLKKDLTKN